MIKSNFRKWTGRGLIYILTANPFLNSCTLETTEIYKLKEDIEYTNYNEHQIKLKEHQVKSHMKRTTNYKNELVERIIQKESSGNPSAFREATGARGLMQITPIVLEEWNKINPQERHTEDDLFNPRINRKIGEWYLFERIEKHYLPFYDLEPSLENKLTAYNWGIGNLRRTGDAIQNWNKLPNETKKYITDISR